jgi:hypothetical protein
VVLQFESMTLPDGRTLPIRTTDAQIVGREAGRADRLKDAALRSLPYHRTFMGKGSVYGATLVEPLSFGSAVPIPLAERGTAPVAGSVLKARLTTPLNSSTAARGARVEAVLNEPVFAADHRVILPEGTTLLGEVTFAKAARRFRRNGQLRFLFGSLQAPSEAPLALKAALSAVESSNTVVDEEGGATIKNSKARFAAPALAALALVGSLHGRLDYDTDGLGPETAFGGGTSGVLGGFLGLSITGVAASTLGATATAVLAGLGVVRTTYSTIFAKGRDVSFPTDTVLQLQLAPVSAPRTPQ